MRVKNIEVKSTKTVIQITHEEKKVLEDILETIDNEEEYGEDCIGCPLYDICPDGHVYDVPTYCNIAHDIKHFLNDNNVVVE